MKRLVLMLVATVALFMSARPAQAQVGLYVNDDVKISVDGTAGIGLYGHLGYRQPSVTGTIKARVDSLLIVGTPILAVGVGAEVSGRGCRCEKQETGDGTNTHFSASFILRFTERFSIEPGFDRGKQHTSRWDKPGHRLTLTARYLFDIADVLVTYLGNDHTSNRQRGVKAQSEFSYHLSGRLYAVLRPGVGVVRFTQGTERLTRTFSEVETGLSLRL